MPLNARYRSLLVTAMLLVLLVVGLLPWASQSALAATFTVLNINDSGAGSLRQAITAANANPGPDTITFAAATNGGTILLASALPDLANSGALTIIGNGAANTVVSGNNSVHLLVVAAGANVSIRGVTLTRGAAGAGNGGAISNGGTLTVISSSLSGNTATNGGGIYNGPGTTLTVNNSSVSANVANDGGGIFAFGSTLTLNNSTFNGNSAAVGGGLFVNGVTATLNNTIIANSISGGSNDCVRAGGTFTAQNSLYENGTCGLANGVNGNLIGDPALGPNLIPAVGSIAIDTGLDSLIPGGITTDLLGNPRIQGARVDMGAFESGLVAPVPTSTPVATPTTAPTITASPTRTPVPAPPITATSVSAPPTTATSVPPVGPAPTKRPEPHSTATPLGRITGTVINLTTGAVVPGVAVQVGTVIVISDANGNYDRTGLPAGDYPVLLLPTPEQGEAAQGLIVIHLPAGATVVQHLALRTPLPESGGAPGSGPGAEATATPVAGLAATPTVAIVPLPAALPKTGSPGGPPLALIVLALALIVAGLGLAGRAGGWYRARR